MIQPIPAARTTRILIVLETEAELLLASLFLAPYDSREIPLFKEGSANPAMLRHMPVCRLSSPAS